MTWRERFRPLVTRIITDVGTDDMTALRKALRDGYPAGLSSFMRGSHPYKAWLKEIREQLREQHGIGYQKPIPQDPNQMDMWEEPCPET